MKFTLSWLKRHLDTDATLEQISETLTDIGLEVEEITNGAENYAPFKVAYVESAEQHPDADRLQVCTVKSDQGTFQVVCGAPNARAGMKGIFAPEKTYIPGLDVTLKKAKIRGVESSGMLVSEKEMCLSDEHNGIIEVDEKYDIGTPMAAIFGLDDPLIEIALTPNRADCAGIRGIARDLAAAGLGTLKDQDESAINGTFKSPITVTTEDKDGCPHFMGRTIKNVKNGESPDWFQTLLKSIGLRPISALVDITNFMSIDQCRPLHVYDADKLNGNITVRKTTDKDGKIQALDDKTYDIIEGAVGICDDSGVIGLGGIVGGLSTGSTEDTTTVFLESAYFTPERIARTGRDLGVQSDARYRFERGIDPLSTAAGLEIATRLIIEFCGGKPSEIVEAGSIIDWKNEIAYDPARVEKMIGLDVPEEKQKDILTALGFECSGKTITPPSWRGDVFGAADIVEEVIRIVGFDAIPSVSVRNDNAVPDENSAETPLLSAVRKARGALTSRGLDECVTWSFMNDELSQHFGLNDNDKRAALTITNAISSEIDVMRPSVLPNLIDAAKRNAAKAVANTAMCEIGPIFHGVKPDDQQTIASGIRAGSLGDRNWSDQTAARPVDAYDVKADAIAALEACGAPAANAQISNDAPDYYHPGRSGSIRLGQNILATFGEIHPAVLSEMNVKMPVCGFEVYLQNIPQSRQKGTEKKLLTLEPLQPLTKDFAFIVDENVKSEDIRRAALAADKALITDASVFDVYAGKGIEDGKKSLALCITIQPKDQSLNDKDLDALMTKVINTVSQKTGATLRG